METVSLGTIARGALEERFKDALQRVIENIQDVNTDAKKKREITLKLTIAPDELREVGSVALDVAVKLATPKTLGTTFFMGQQKGHVVVYEQNPRQPGLFERDEEEPKTDRPKLVEMKKYAD